MHNVTSSVHNLGKKSKRGKEKMSWLPLWKGEEIMLDIVYRDQLSLSGRRVKKKKSEE